MGDGGAGCEYCVGKDCAAGYWAGGVGYWAGGAGYWGGGAEYCAEYGWGAVGFGG